MEFANKFNAYLCGYSIKKRIFFAELCKKYAFWFGFVQ